MSNYYTPDDRWKLIYQVDSLDEYLKRFVIKGKFHDKVPDDIKEAWTTVEYLQAHAYYYWPMYDEALNKALLILEMAVKKKAEELGISLKTRNKKGELVHKPLGPIIDQVFKGKYQRRLKKNIHNARSIRNSKMHPSNNSFMGGTEPMTAIFISFINLLNAIYQEEAWHIVQFEMENKLRPFSNSLFISETGNLPTMLFTGIIDFRAWGNHLVVACHPVLNDICEVISRSSSAIPTFISLENCEITKDEIRGKSPKGQDITLYKTNEQKDISRLKKYQQQIKTCPNIAGQLYLREMGRNAARQLDQMEYERL